MTRTATTHASETHADGRDDPVFSRVADARRPLVAVAGFSFLLNLLYLASPLYMLQVYDRVLSSGRPETLLMLTVIAVACFAVLGFLDALRSVVLSRVAGWFTERLSEDVATASLRSTLAGKQPGSAPLRDLSVMQQFASGQGVKALFDGPFTPVFVFAIFMLHWALGVVTLVAGAMLAALAFANERLTRDPLKKGAGAQADAHATVDAALRNAEAVAAMGMGPAVFARFRARLADAAGASGVGEERGAIATGATKGLRQTVQMAILGVGALLVLAGDLTGGAMIAGSILLGRALAPVEQALGAWRQFVAARAAHERLAALLDAHPADKPAMELPAATGAVSVEAATFRPEGADRPILTNVSLSLTPGEALAVIGPSASGKSTLCRLLAGVWRPTLGAVRLDGAELHHWPAAALGAAVGYVPQNVELFAGTVRENIARLTDGEAREVVKAAVRAGVHDMVLRLPDGYDTEIGPGGARLSAGQRQRVALARALYGEPKLLILDEPNSNLDQEGEEALAHAIEGMKGLGAAVVIVAHRPSALSSVDRILSLRAGAVDLFGPRDEVLAELLRRRRQNADLRLVGAPDEAPGDNAVQISGAAAKPSTDGPRASTPARRAGDRKAG